MNSFRNAKEKNYHGLRKNDNVIDLSSGSDEDVIVVKEERNKSEIIIGQESESFSVSSESELSDNNFDDININVKSYDSDGDVSDVNTGIVVKWRKVVSPKGWTNKMRKYYNKPCSVQRYFDWKKFVAKMRRDKSVQWYISDRDIYSVPFRLKRCLICRQTDHLSNKCPKKYGNCSMCGVPGHHYSRCPLSMCLNCGVQKNNYVDYCSRCDYWKKVKCNSCKRFGHETKNCSDQWRRFHSTVDSKKINSFGSTLNKNIQCCNCAKSGHLYEDCKEQYFSGYMPSSSIVGDYGDINEKLDLKSNHLETVSSKHGKRSRLNINISDSEDEIIGKKYRKLNKQREHADKKRPVVTFIGISSPFRSSRLPNIKKAKKRRKKKKNRSFLEEN